MARRTTKARTSRRKKSTRPRQRRPIYTKRRSIPPTPSPNIKYIKPKYTPIKLPQYKPPTNLTLNENTVIYRFGSNYDKWANAPKGKRPADGESDTTQYAQPNAGAIVQSDYSSQIPSLDSITKAPAAIKRFLLTGLFGVALGTAIDYMLGGPLGLTSKLIRFLIRLLPGGSILLALFDTATSLFSHFGGDERAAKTVLQNPQIIQLTEIAKPYTSHEAAEKLVEIAAEKQIGHGNKNALLLGVANALYLMLSKKISGRGYKKPKTIRSKR